MDRRAISVIVPLLSFAAFMTLARCASTGPVTPGRIQKKLASVKDSLVRDRNAMRSLDRHRVGRSGFMYVVDTEGRVVFHPQTVLIGSSFKDHWFINRIVAEGTGCISYRLGNRIHLVFFDAINETEVLCCSILAEDVAPFPAECRSAETE
ncbi:MAG: hypothetical protein JW838_14050 [Spirochaetes bacterium]|nr:hypothetical protein [Spirochaetota bacterium]